MAHIVSKALADYFDAIHHTLYQVSTSSALVQGVYQGAVRIATLREHGDLGLGTFLLYMFVQQVNILAGPGVV